MSKSKLVAAALAAMLSAGVAHAGDVHWSVTIGAPIGLPAIGHVQVHVPVPAVVHPVPVVVAPRPVYYPAAPVYVPAPRAVHYVRHGHGYYDADRDGIPNRYDRVYNPPWDRDGDGIPNRYDHRPNKRHHGHGGHANNGHDDQRGWGDRRGEHRSEHRGRH